MAISVSIRKPLVADLKKKNDQDKITRRIVSLLTAWHSWAIYPTEFLEGLESIYFPDRLQNFLRLASSPAASAPLTQTEVKKKNRKNTARSNLGGHDDDGEGLKDSDLEKNLRSLPHWARKDFMVSPFATLAVDIIAADMLPS